MSSRKTADTTHAPGAWSSSAAQQVVTAYVRELQSALRLSDWEILVDMTRQWEFEEEFARIEAPTNQKRATIVISRMFWEQDTAQMRHALVHELVHCHLFAVHHQAEFVFEDTLKPKAAMIAGRAVLNEVEKSTDAMADVLCTLLPPMPDPRDAVEAAVEPEARTSTRAGRKSRSKRHLHVA